MTDPDAYFVGGGLVESAPHFRDWFLDTVRAHTLLREEQRGAAFALVPDLDKAGARGSARAALALVQQAGGHGAGPGEDSNPRARRHARAADPAAPRSGGRRPDRL